MLTQEQIKMFQNMPTEKFYRWLNFYDTHLTWMFLAFIACFFINDGWQGMIFIAIFAIQGGYKNYLVVEYVEWMKVNKPLTTIHDKDLKR